MLSRFWHPLGSSLASVLAWVVQDILHVVFLASLAFSSESQESTIHVSQTGIRQIPPQASQHLAVPEVRDHLAPRIFNLKFRISSAFVDLLTIAPLRILVHLLSNPCPTLIRVKC